MSSLAYQRLGSGPPLVLIHGTGGSSETWRPVLDLLAAEREVFAIDLPGFGATPPQPAGRPPTIPRQAAAVAQWIGEQGLDRPQIAGNSLGGAVALELARLGCAGALIVLSPLGFATPVAFAYSAFALRAMHRGARLIGPIAPTLLGNPVGRTLALWQVNGRPWRVTPEAALAGAQAMLDAPSFMAQIDAAKGYEVAPLEPSAAIPITIAWGRRDLILPRRQAKRARRVVPQARFVSLPGCGHVPMADDPELVAAVILEGARPHDRAESGSVSPTPTQPRS